MVGSSIIVQSSLYCTLYSTTNFDTNTNNNIEYQYNNDGKINPDDVVLYLYYTTYDSNFFHPISVTSYPMILRQFRGCVDS